MKSDVLSNIEAKTLELCGVIVQQEGFRDLHRKLSTFMEDESLKFRFQSLNDLSQLLQQKQASGLELTPEEVSMFESQRVEFIGNPVAKDFLEAQEEVQMIQSSIYRQLSKMFEVGRVPVADDFAGECCNNSGCGCD